MLITDKTGGNGDKLYDVTVVSFIHHSFAPIIFFHPHFLPVR